MNNTTSARINGQNIELFDRNGNRVNYASATGMGADEKWTAAYVNGNHLIGTTNRGHMVTWELRDGSSPSVVGRR